MHDTQKELREIAQLIETWRDARGLSKSALCKLYGHLGSSKTYGRILDPKDDLSEGMDTARQLDNYRAAWEMIKNAVGDPKDSELYPDFSEMSAGITSALTATQESGNNRLVLVIGERGSGKSAFCRILASDKRTAHICSLIEATEAWRESTNELLGEMLMAVGIFERRPAGEDDGEDQRKRDPVDRLPIGPGARLRKLIERLNGRRVIIAIDEGHHIGPAGFNILKTIINQTRAVIVLTAIPVLLTRIIKSSYTEAQQLFENRLFEIHKLRGPSKDTALEMLKRRGIKFASPKAAEDCTAAALRDCGNYALWNYIERLAKEARDKSDSYTGESFAKVITRVKGRITMGN